MLRHVGVWCVAGSIALCVVVAGCSDDHPSTRSRFVAEFVRDGFERGCMKRIADAATDEAIAEVAQYLRSSDAEWRSTAALELYGAVAGCKP